MVVTNRFLIGELGEQNHNCLGQKPYKETVLLLCYMDIIINCTQSFLSFYQ